MSDEEYSSGEENSLITLAFEEFDINGDGFIDQDELRPFAIHLLNTCAYPIHNEYVQALMNVIHELADEDGDGKISFDEFQAHYHKIEEYVASIQESESSDEDWSGEENSLLVMAFQEFDTNGDGHIDASEMRPFAVHLLETCNYPVQDEYVDALIEMIKEIADEDGDGMISYDEFEAHYHKIQEYVASIEDFDSEETE